MSHPVYPLRSTAVLFIDPLNDFISEGGALWPLLKAQAERVGLVPNLRRLLDHARRRALRVVFVPHRRYEEGDYQTWLFANFTHRKAAQYRSFARRGWGGDYPPDLRPQPGEIECAEHWTHSGFANTDLDLLLRQHGIDHIVLCGLRTNACFEATARYGAELGYHVTLLTDATASFHQQEMEATLVHNAPYFAHALMTTDEFIAGTAG
ncbi:MAG: cysteine hydrolase [Piscinibacter sp.]|nr:cysteine hydrolase [Piscinibacter sp.]